MAYTGTLPPKAARDATALPLPQQARGSFSEVKDVGGQGAAVYYLVLLFTFVLLGRPQDFVRILQPVPIGMIFGGTAILLWVFGLFTGTIKFRKSKELNLVLGLSVWFVLGVPFAYWRSNSADMLWHDWLKTVMIFILLTQTVTTLKRVRHLLWVIFMSGLVATGLSLLLGGGLMQNEDARFMGLTRGFFSGNYLGIAAAVTLPYMAAMLVHTRSILKQLLLIGSFATMIFMVVLTASRGNMISIVLSLALVWTMVLKDSLKATMIGVILVVGLVVAVALAPRAFWARVGTLWQPESYATSSVGDSANQSEFQRKGLLIRSLVVTAKKPIFGLGLGNFPTYSYDVTGSPQEWKGTHNTFTQISSEAGIPALILYLILLMTVVNRMRRLARNCEGTPELTEEKSLASATIVSILAFMIGGCFAHLGYEYYLYYLAGIGVALQTVCMLKTGQSLDLPPSGGKKSSGWRRVRHPAHEARA